MCIFQSEQVIKLRNILLSLKKKQVATEFARFQTIWLLCVGPDARMLSEIHAITVKHCWAEDSALLSIWNDLSQEFIDRQSHHFKRARLWSCVAAAGGHF